MNIWYFHHYATPNHIAGLHRPFEFGKYFCEQGDCMTVFSSSYLHYSDENMITDKRLFIKETYDGIDTVFIRTKGYQSSGVKRIVNMWQFYRRLFPVAKKYAKEKGKPDIIIASSPHPLVMMAGLGIARKYKIPCICEVRDFWPEVFFTGGRLKENSLLGRFLLYKERKIYEKADGLLFLKEGDHTYITDKKWDVDNGGKIDMSKCHYINNGVSIEKFDANVVNFPINGFETAQDKFIVTYCGAIRPVNKVDLLLDAAKELDESYQIHIYGTGNCVEQLQNRIVNEKISNVILKGYIENKYVPFVLSQSSVNILNYSGQAYNWSRGNSSNKLFEYLASGKPVISTVKMGYDILERYACGISTEECNGENIAKAIKLIKNYTTKEYQQMACNARQAALQFDIAHLSKEYRNVLSITKEKYMEQKNHG